MSNYKNIATMNNTPQSLRLNIGFFGRCNAGKSSIINLLSGQSLSIVSEVAGTTTDSVIKSMEIGGIGPVVLIDTAGYDDTSSLGDARREQTLRAAQRSDVAVLVCGAADDYSAEKEWAERFTSKGVPVVVILNKIDVLISPKATAEAIAARLGIEPIAVSATSGVGRKELIDALVAAAAKIKDQAPTITGSLVEAGDTVVLVMPQDSQAPAGRLIMPQVQTIRELLDKRATAVCCVPEELEPTLAGLSKAPKLIITDSQVFGYVAERVPSGTLLTSFSVLMAGHKGDIDTFAEGAKAIDGLTEQSRVLIAEACSHAPATEDIGRVKIPAMLRKRVGQGLTIDVVGGNDFPAQMGDYDLVIHCGACMFNRRYVLSRMAACEAAGVPITNYGIAIAHLQGILPRVVWPTKNNK